MKNKFYVILSFVIVATLLFSSVAAAQPIVPTDPVPVKDKLQVEAVAVYDEASMKNAIRTDDGKISVIVQLADPAVASYDGGIADLRATSPKATGKVKLDMSAPEAQSYQAYLKGVQKDFVSQVNTAISDVDVLMSYQVVLNAVAMQVPERELSRLAMMDGVVKIYPNQIREVNLDASLDIIKAEALWAKLGGESNAGKGVKVAVVDTGLDITNPMFDGTGFTAPAGYPKGYCVTNASDPDFQCNGKVIAARYFYDPGLLSGGNTLNPSEVMSPLDIGGHGSHTASTSAGNKVTAARYQNAVIEGVAPAAYLMIYKGLFEIIKPDGTDSGSGTDVMLSAGLEAAVADGADVINNSWGGGAGGNPNDSVYKPLLDGIIEAGVVVVFSAGNNGPAANTIGCPGCTESVITVGASTNSRRYNPVINVLGPGTVDPSVQNIEVKPAGPIVTTTIATDLVDVGTVATNATATNRFLACNANPPTAGSLTGKIAIVSRGTCNFTEKIANVTAAGAVAVIIYNAAGSADRENFVSMAVGGTTIPSANMRYSDGLALMAWLNANNGVAPGEFTADWKEFESVQDVMASFSSIGPNGDPNILKPDLVAPGVDILAAYSPALVINATHPYYAPLQGTSMAAPHVTGAAALLIQQHPDWTPAMIKTALMSTANQSLKKPNGVTPADPFDMGAGRIDLEKAGNAGVVFDKGSYASAVCVMNCAFGNTVHGVAGSNVAWTASVKMDHPLASAALSKTAFTLSEGMGAYYTLSVDLSKVPTNAWYFGWVTFTAAGDAYPAAHLPIAIYAAVSNDASHSLTVSPATAKKGDTVTYTLTLSNPFANTTTFDATIDLDPALTYVPGTVTNGLTYANGLLTGSATLTGFMAGIQPVTTTTYMDHIFDSNNDLVLSDICGDCDEKVYSITGMDFYYMGVHYDRLKVSSNGWMVPGAPTVSSAGPTNKHLPDPTLPNNIIAPFWTDLFLDEPTAAWGIWGATDGTDTYTVFDWQDVSPYDGTVASYNVQLWIKDGTNEIWFAYGDLGTLPTGLTVGMETITGTAGESYYYIADGTPAVGTPPAKGTDLVVLNNMDMETFMFQAAVTDPDLNTGLAKTQGEVINNNDASKAHLVSTLTFAVLRTYLPFVIK
ncbi:MAG TPA: S8 family serine peptidase [Anaerolineaceae bacterium]|nr:S8 family serine peptidase [Anaerolineaceae bacterium]HPN53500.1 S8 family serine peptidase [Anaerolineaceae bacterium]